MKKITTEQLTTEQETVIREYYSTKGLAFCARLLGLSKSFISKHANFLGIKTKAEQTYAFLDQFLDIKDPYVAYFLGFMWADGNIDYNSIRLEISDTDAQELKPLFGKIGVWKTSSRQRYKKGKKFGSLMTCFRLSDKKLASLLRDCDYKIKSTVSPNKILNKIPSDLHKYFWRGYLDGDGNINVSVERKEYFERLGVKVKARIFNIAFWSTLNQDWTSLIEFLELQKVEHHITFYQRLSKNGKIHKSSALAINGNASQKLSFLQLLYSDGPMGISKKYNKVEIAEEYVRTSLKVETSLFYKERRLKIRDMLLDNMSYGEIGEVLGLNAYRIKEIAGTKCLTSLLT
jgi:hypothetical protein